MAGLSPTPACMHDLCVVRHGVQHAAFTSMAAKMQITVGAVSIQLRTASSAQDAQSCIEHLKMQVVGCHSLRCVMNVQDRPDCEDQQLDPAGSEMQINEQAADQRCPSSKPAIPMRRRVILESDDECGDDDSHAAQPKPGAVDMDYNADAGTTETWTRKAKVLKGQQVYSSPCAFLSLFKIQEAFNQTPVSLAKWPAS